MAPTNVFESLECESCRVGQEQEQMQNALKMLFDLLEEYAPSWYTEEHHGQALSALEALAERRGQQRAVGGPRT
jgi:hypothetical protein